MYTTPDIQFKFFILLYTALIPVYVHIANNLTEKKSIFGVHQLTETPILPFNLSIQAIMEFKTRRSLCL